MKIFFGLVVFLFLFGCTPYLDGRPQFCVKADQEAEAWGLDKAIETWSDPRSNVRFSKEPCDADSIPVYVYVVDPGECEQWAGLAINEGSYRVVELNDHCQMNQTNKENTILHEFGHVAGVEHVEDPTNVMNPKITGVTTVDPDLYRFTEVELR